MNPLHVSSNHHSKKSPRNLQGFPLARDVKVTSKREPELIFSGMELAISSPETLSEPLRMGTVLPLSKMVERTSSGKKPYHPLETKLYAKLKSNRLIQAEPPELHYSGFQLENDYTKILKLINISADVMIIHIIPTQTKHFKTSYTKKFRLVPGLAYAVKVKFCPDEWRYFYDCIRIHCKGEENLLIPVHAYPVINDLHIPPFIDLSAVPLGQSSCHAIPLRCSCPVDFEFQVHIIQPHDAFFIQPLTGVITANGEMEITVTFSPLQYETSQCTFQLIISQFKTKPYLCTVSGTSAPQLALSEEIFLAQGDSASEEIKRQLTATRVPPQSKTKHRMTKEPCKSKREEVSVIKPPIDVSTPAGVAKMLMKDTNKLKSKDLREVISCGSMVGLQSKQMKHALLMKNVEQNVKEEQANHLRWQAHLGSDPMTDQKRRQVTEEREIALHEYMMKGDVKQEEVFTPEQPMISSRRMNFEAGQVCTGLPSFQIYSSFQWELRQRALKLFQKAARKVVIQCRMNRRLTSLKKLSDSMKNPSSANKDKEEDVCELKISQDKVIPFTFPIFPNKDDPLTPSTLVPMPVDPIEVTVTKHIPFFKLRVPQHYKLMGYQPVSTWDALNLCTPKCLARPLRTGAPDELLPIEIGAQPSASDEPSLCEDYREKTEGGFVEAKEAVSLSFNVPEALFLPVPANPLRIFNPAPGLQTYKPTPKYLESDPEFHLCPLPRYTIPDRDVCGIRLHTQKKFLDRKEVIKGFSTWKNFDLITSNCLSHQPTLNSDFCAERRSVNYSTDILPLTAPPPLTGPPNDPPPVMDKQANSSEILLTPAMIRAQFMSGQRLVSNSNVTRGMTARHQRELQMEATHRSELNRMGKRVMTRLKQLEVTDGASHSAPDNCE